MAVVAKFQADFSNFSDAVQKAEVGLRSFEQGAGKVSTSLDKLTNSFSGRNVIQEATLMAAAFERLQKEGVGLTADELKRMGDKASEAVEKMKALGLDIPAGVAKLADQTKTATSSLEGMKKIALDLANAFGIAFSIGAIVNFGREIFALADNIVKLSDKTGLSVEEVQRLSYVAEQSGNNIDQLTDAISKMQVNLSNPKAQEAVRNLKINFEQLQAAKPYQQLQLIADAIGQVADPAKQAEYAVSLFGKAGAEILPTLKSHFSELAKEVTTASDQEVRAMDAAGDALARLSSNVKNEAINVAGSFILAGEQAKNVGLLKVLAAFVAEGAPATIAALAAVGGAAKSAGKDINLPIDKDPLDEYRKHLDETRASVDNLTAAQKATIDEAVKLGAQHSDIASNLHLSVEAVDAFIKAEQEATDQRIFVAALADQWHYLYSDMHLTGVKMMNEYTKAVQDAMAKQREVVQAAQLQLINLIVEQRKQIDQINGTALTGVDAQMDALQKKYDADIRNIEQLGRAAATEGVGGPEWSAKAQEAVDNAYRIYVDGFQKIVAASNKAFGTDVPDAMTNASEAAASSASGVADPFTAAFNNISSAADTMAAHVASVLGAITQTDAYRKAGFFVNPGFGTAETINHGALKNIGLNLPGFANGVMNYAGGPAVVGERGPELVNLPRGSSVTPNGAWGGVTIAPGAIVIQGHGAQAGRDAGNAILALLKSKGNRV